MAMRRRYCVVAALLLLVAGCSSQKEGSSDSSSSNTSTNSSGGCKPSPAAQQAYEAPWTQGAQAFGIDQLDVTKLNICEVDTAKYKQEPQDGGFRIALAAQGPTNSWAAENEAAFKAQAKAKGAKVLYASANGDATKQVDNIQQLASQKPDAMVVVPMGPGIVGQVKAAAAQGIPVVACAGQLPDNSGVVSTVTRSYDLQGKLWAEWVAKQIGGKGRIAMISGIAGVPTAEFPKAAAEKVFADKYPDIKIVAKQYDDWSPTKAKTVAQSLVPKNLDAIWSDSSFTALGVYEAYTQAGKPVPPVTGDASNAFLKAVQGKDVKFALSPFPPELASQCFDTALDIVQGKPVANFVNVQAPAFTNADAGKYIKPQCSDNLWVPATLPEPEQKALKLC
jgi:ribose transport system substrate-binding protein